MESIRVLQANLNRSILATESILELTVELKIDLILIQEPYILSPDNPIERRSINHNSFSQILPAHHPGQRPRTLVYVLRFLKNTQINYKAIALLSLDTILLEVEQGKSKFYVLNLYNQNR